MKRKFLPVLPVLAVLFLGIGSLSNVSCTDQKANSSPNIIVFFIDDLGWTDLTCYGSKVYETPAIDQLARNGIRFTNAYSACTVCSPSRAAIMTGKYPARLRLTDWIEGHKKPNAKLKVPDWKMYLDTSETTIAEELKKAGYATGIIGKWHLGEDSLYWPKQQGFDVNIGGYNRGQPGSYFFPYDGKREGWGIPPNLDKGAEDEYLTYRLTDEAKEFIRHNKNNSFFLYFAHYAVHTPLQAPDSLIGYYKSRIKEGDLQDNPFYAAMVRTMDQSVGQILDVLKEEGLMNNTAILFTSDNGGLVLRNVTDNSPLRAGKGSTYEGGVRVPFIAKIPGITPVGKVCSEPVITMDLFPTILGLAGIDVKEHDGKNLLPLLKNPDEKLNRSSLFWHYPHYHPGGATPYSAVRQGDWKLIYFFEDEHMELFNLADDISESVDLATKNPGKVWELKQILESYWKETNAQMPSVNTVSN